MDQARRKLDGFTLCSYTSLPGALLQTLLAKKLDSQLLCQKISKQNKISSLQGTGMGIVFRLLFPLSPSFVK